MSYRLANESSAYIHNIHMYKYQLEDKLADSLPLICFDLEKPEEYLYLIFPAPDARGICVCSAHSETVIYQNI